MSRQISIKKAALLLAQQNGSSKGSRIHSFIIQREGAAVKYGCLAL